MYKTIIRYQGIIAILVGIVLILFAIALSDNQPSLEQKHPQVLTETDPATRELAQKNGITIRTSILGTLQAIGIALIGFGIFGLLVETRSWRNYFGKRLRDIVIEQTYLSELDVDTLKNLQIKVLKALFKDSDIDKEGSFLNYFQTNLHKFISEPYREDVTTTLTLLREEIDGSLLINDRVSYTCRKAGGAIQSSIRWQPDEGEFLKVDSLTIGIKYPQGHPQQGTFEKLFEDNDITAEKLHEFKAIVDLDKYKDIDGLTIITESTYYVAAERFEYWTMAHPTRNFVFLIAFPDNFRCQVKPLVLHSNIIQTSENERSFTIRYESWMLPESGVAWRFIKK